MSRGVLIALTIVGILFSVLIVGGAGFQWVNSQPWFCNSCHEMNYYYNSWQKSTHGSVARCLDCHAEPGIQGFITEKVRGAEQVVAHFSGNYTLPIKIILRVKNNQCLACHPEAPTLADKTIEVRHDIHTTNNVLCADCHSRLVHALPDQPKVIQRDQCESCHKAHPASLMTGVHLTLNCSQCHLNGKYQQQDAKCESCHDTPSGHTAGINNGCDYCHTPAGWKPAKFNHSTFPLVGNHQGLPCEKCHLNGRFQGTSPECEFCHQIPINHLVGITTGCSLCHSPAGWKPIIFDHNVFPLIGNHQGLLCEKCHPNGKFQGTSQECETCHQLPPNHLAGITTGCSLCHSPMGWKPIIFDHSIFPLIGNHQELTCEKCHPNGKFQGTSQKCETCHQVPANHLTGITTGCAVCHTPAGWKPALYDHSAFPLIGNHSGLPCEKCHPNNQYQGTSPQCETCHQLPTNHLAGITTGCAICHTPAGWTPVQVDHSKFPLTGVHTTISCGKCHTSGVFQGLPTACSSCHTPPNTHLGMSIVCSQCHTTSGFTPSTFRHQQVGEHIPRGEVPLQCSRCHPTRFAEHSCTGSGCHSSNNPHD